ncbi:MAG: PDZ domain-containing protein, partial [Gemmatimonadales bacterium]
KLVDMVREHDVGDTVEVTYRRGRDTRTAQVVLQSAADWLTATLSVEPRGVFRVGPGDMDDIMIPDMGPNAFARVIVSGTSLDDMELVSLNEDLGAYFGTTEGVLVIQPGDDNLQLRGGDVILAIGDRTVDGPSRVFRILRSYEPGEEVMLTVMRNGDEITVTGTIPERNQGVYLNRRRR